MPFHVKRSQTAQASEMTTFNGARAVTWPEPPRGHSFFEKQYFPAPSKLEGVPDSENLLIPPMHWHWRQEEYFTVTHGRFIFTLEGREFTVSATDEQTKITIPVLLRHTFKVDPTCTEPCGIELSTLISPAGEEEGATERFFRNLYSYLEDCHQQKVAPSLPQLLLFLDSAEVSLAFPGPGWIARPLSYAFGVVVGRWLGWLLGYRASYPEYYRAYDQTTDSRKDR
ncbi:hypothetical protein K431DRAFT_225703 [Polychaeton citri CBS 116435]|uniref:Uncharacterized protein n=1 Tax=Polychaeton citri CBS 116435 TaxID=1314669 RepID=A0A9P4Q6L7_9PEZI|nr:hypothetical protein K431DRAFT_225703 [Polychaeton citri CBS 116435]